MNQHQWYERGLDVQWRHFIAQDIFNMACGVLIEEASSVRTPPQSTEVNALQNQFREGMFSTIRSLRALAQPRPEPKEPLSKPWDRKREEEELPPGPKRPGEP